MITWKLETVPIKTLKEFEKNPRNIKKEQQQHLTVLIEKFGLIDKPIINTDYMIIGGHQRVKILKKMKVKEVECWIPSETLTQEDIEHLCIGLNLNQGQFDYDILADQWEPLDLLKYGFTEQQLIGSFEKEEGEEKEDKKAKKQTECPSCGCVF